MRGWLRRTLSGHYLNRRGTEVALLVGLALFLELAAGTGLAYLAGFGKVGAVLANFQWPWLTGLFGALFISFAGYYYAYWGIFRVEGGPALPAETVARRGGGGLRRVPRPWRWRTRSVRAGGRRR